MTIAVYCGNTPISRVMRIYQEMHPDAIIIPGAARLKVKNDNYYFIGRNDMHRCMGIEISKIEYPVNYDNRDSEILAYLRTRIREVDVKR